eukprot:553064-Hanusia_phi.AAC.4
MDGLRLMEKSRCAGVMIARGVRRLAMPMAGVVIHVQAVENPSCFRKDGLLPCMVNSSRRYHHLSPVAHPFTPPLLVLNYSYRRSVFRVACSSIKCSNQGLAVRSHKSSTSKTSTTSWTCEASDHQLVVLTCPLRIDGEGAGKLKQRDGEREILHTMSSRANFNDCKEGMGTRGERDGDEAKGRQAEKLLGSVLKKER